MFDPESETETEQDFIILHHNLSVKILYMNPDPKTLEPESAFSF